MLYPQELSGSREHRNSPAHFLLYSVIPQHPPYSSQKDSHVLGTLLQGPARRAVMFRRQFTFRRKASDDNAEEDLGIQRTLSPFSSDAPRSPSISREPSPGASSTNSDAYSINRQFTSSAPASRQGTWSSFLQARPSTRGADSSAEDPLGLTVVYQPAGQRRVDIVFVHGLGGGSRRTWSYNRDPTFFWPLKFLPSNPPVDEARILTFGYNANFRPGSGSGGNKMSILDFAKDLLWELKYARDESVGGNLRMGERPIIFIAHSMGGLVVKEAYLRGQIDPGYAPIIKAIVSIIFLSTPHRGTNLAETLNRILQVSFAASPMQFISELSAGSQTIRSLNEDFRHIAPKLNIYSFYETQPTPLVGSSKIKTMVVDRDSSVLGYTGEETKPLNADHHNVCKYASPDDPAYRLVSNALKTVIEEIPGASPPGAGALSVVADLREYLSLPELPDADFTFFRNRRTPGTCTWILSHDTFTGWMDDTTAKPRVLWVHGTAASGKSVLSSFVINHMVESGLACHYFFIRFTSREKRGISTMLRSVAYQLATSTPAYAERIRQLEAAGTDLKTEDYHELWQWLFQRALFQLDHLDRPLYLIIDGLDEADRPGSVIRLMADLHLTSLPIRILVVSRSTHELSSAFQRLANKIDMETIRIDGNPVDFRTYIDQEMELGGDAEYKEHVANQLLDRAKGNFLWVHLAVQEINSCHTRPEIEKALTELPSGMEALYDRMAASVEAASNKSKGEQRKLGQTIIGWVACAQRLLTVDELADALKETASGFLEMRRSIVDLCGGFVTVDQEGRVAMIHQTAREFLTRGAEKGRSLVIDVRPTNDALLKRCLAQLTHPSLRSQVKHGRAPALTQYAATAWPHHLTLSSALTNPEILDAVATFLKGPDVLTWIEIAARSKELRALVAASRHLADILIKLRRRTGEDESLEDCQAAAVVDGWATDLVKIVGKFGSNLRSKPDSIYQLIPPFCPEESMMYRQFGCKESRLGRLHVSGLTSSTWDDCLARFSLPTGSMASSIITAGGRIALLSMFRTSSEIIIYNSATLEEQRRLSHPERVLMIQANKLGDMLVSYGYKTTRVWDVSSGDCLKTVPSPAKRPHSIIFAERQNMVLVCGEDRRIRSFTLDDDSAEWTVHVEIEEQSVLDDPILNFPICSALSPDGSKVAFGYRNHPLTVWDLEGENGPERMAFCYGRPDEADMALEQEVWGEVFQVAWHPLSNEVFGLTQVGLLFRWDPDDDYTAADVEAWGKCLAINRDGSLVATGDGVGTIKIFASADFSKLYQLSSKDPVLYLTFSSDSRRLYDVRGLYGSVWEPNTLVRLADCPDHNSDTNSETESLAKVSLLAEHHSARVDRVICLAGQSFGPLYCYGTVGGVVTLGEAGRGVVCELARVSSYMQIKHIVWSGDGRLLAFSDLSGKLIVKRVARSGQQRSMWETSDEFGVKISPKDGNIISQLIFHPTGSEIFAATPVNLFSIDIQSRTIMESPLEPGSEHALKVKWACHPTRSDTLLGFGNAKVHVFSWNDLRQTEVHTYFPLRAGRSSTLSISSAAYALAPSVQNDTEKLGRLITNTDSPEILLEISSPTPSGQFKSQYLLFDIGNLQLGEDDPAGSPKMLPYSVLDPEMSSRIREPLAILSRRRLAFLDVDRWVCTWRLPSTTWGASQLQTRRTSQPGVATGIERYYFLPSDWVTGNDTRLCSVTPDGTLLCSRNGDVVTVQTSKLRK
ncbi:uncharacterized protein B0T15DRAFT_13768 [Chaetomium strumarium]|uniref:NACHT domain-containing protein n=1 Tax=Chaetomium strumarium TaxID=1170767 RepID=A0AAJ0H0V5_9PEZI|nr:hypothetical protein B0T15DRAFT_13768 [Chaetomium strumarium]